MSSIVRSIKNENICSLLCSTVMPIIAGPRRSLWDEPFIRTSPSSMDRANVRRLLIALESSFENIYDLQ
jgi:hypothetical protein